MKQKIGYIAVLVRNYDEAIQYYTAVLGFQLIEDSVVDVTGKRWVLVAPPGASECRLLLARAVTPEETNAVGRQAGTVAVFADLYGNRWDLLQLHGR